jgi:hypothetical protein
MKWTLYILATLASLGGCIDHQPEASATNTERPVTSGLTEQQKAEIAKKYGLEKPDEPLGNFSIEIGPSFTDSGILFDTMGIANKSEADVEALLGKPVETETGEWTLHRPEEKTPFTRHVYETETGKIDVMFIEGKAARIEVKLKEAFKFPDDAIKAMRAAGLTVRDGLEPESGAPHFLDFAGIDGVYAVRVVKDLEGNPENIGYVKIVTEERYK